MITYQDRIRGSLIGGATGDALGYTIEFVNENRIFGQFGEKGITGYAISQNGKQEALFSDDTQMTLFTANGVLCAENIEKSPHSIEKSYFDWLVTQYYSFEESRHILKHHNTWLRDVPGLYSPRAPGNTCLAALRHRLNSPDNVVSFIADTINNSKGCGGVMRVAPVGLYYREADGKAVAKAAAEAAAVTHSHPLGYLPAAIFAYILHDIVCAADTIRLKESVLRACQAIQEIFDCQPEIEQMNVLMYQAIELSENTDTDLENIHRLGEGWVGDEALAIAVYCSLRHEHDFSSAIIAAVNHKGDSDSTGSIAGNIVGALVGYEAIDDKWKQRLELRDIILKVSDELSDTAV